MNPKISNNGTSGVRNPTLDPQAPKTETDEKITRHFNGIIFAILAALALGVLLAIWIFIIAGRRASLTSPRSRALKISKDRSSTIHRSVGQRVRHAQRGNP